MPTADQLIMLISAAVLIVFLFAVAAWFEQRRQHAPEDKTPTLTSDHAESSTTLRGADELHDRADGVTGSR